jgi:hypothetical protein
MMRVSRRCAADNTFMIISFKNVFLEIFSAKKTFWGRHFITLLGGLLMAEI